MIGNKTFLCLKVWYCKEYQMFKIPTFRLKLQPSSAESDKNLHRERTYNEEKYKFQLITFLSLRAE